jgi:hypothetical protein
MNTRNKTLDQLAESIHPAAMAVGELESVAVALEMLRDTSDPRAGIQELADSIRARIEKLDESGEARAWNEAWRKAEANQEE